MLPVAVRIVLTVWSKQDAGGRALADLTAWSLDMPRHDAGILFGAIQALTLTG